MFLAIRPIKFVRFASSTRWLFRGPREATKSARFEYYSRAWQGYQFKNHPTQKSCGNNYVFDLTASRTDIKQFFFVLFYFIFIFIFSLQNFEDVTREICLYFKGLKSHSVPRFEPKDNPIFWALKIYMVLELRATHEVISENTNSGSTRVKFNLYRGLSDLTVANTQTNVSAKIRIQSNLSPQLPPWWQKKVAVVERCPLGPLWGGGDYSLGR